MIVISVYVAIKIIFRDEKYHSTSNKNEILRLIMMAGHVAVVVTPMRADLGPRTGRRPVISQVTLVWFPSNTSS